MILSPVLSRLADRVAIEKEVITRKWDANAPYLTRWTIYGSSSRKPGGNGSAVFLHHFQRSDADEMHDHPWAFTSVILAGGYYEITPAPGWANGVGPVRKRWYGPGRILSRPAEWIHRVEIPDGREAWTLIFRGRKVRPWGFWCPVTGFIPWKVHEAAANRTGGNGCG